MSGVVLLLPYTLSCLGQEKIYLLEALAILLKAAINFVISFCPSICPSVRMEQLSFRRTYFHENQYWRIFRKSVEKIQVSLKSYKNNGYFTWRPIYEGGLKSCGPNNEKKNL